MSQDINQIKAAFKNKTAKIGIIGLGYVGLPLIMAFIEKKFQVYGFDIDETKITALNQGKSYIKHISSEKIANCTISDQFKPTNDFTKISLVDAILIFEVEANDPAPSIVDEVFMVAPEAIDLSTYTSAVPTNIK